MHFCLIFSYTFLSCIQTPASHHVVFEEIGTMAGALLYIHAIVLFNITRLIQTVQRVQWDMDTIAAGFQKLNKIKQNEHLRMDTNAWLNIMKLDFKGLIANIEDLRATLPRTSSVPTPSKKFRIKRTLPLAILQGVFGTLMDWFSHCWLNNLRDQLQEVQGQQNQLLQVQIVALHHIEELEKLMSDFIYELHHQQHIVTWYWSLG